MKTWWNVDEKINFYQQKNKFLSKKSKFSTKNQKHRKCWKNRKNGPKPAKNPKIGRFWPKSEVFAGFSGKSKRKFPLGIRATLGVPLGLRENRPKSAKIGGFWAQNRSFSGPKSTIFKKIDDWRKNWFFEKKLIFRQKKLNFDEKKLMIDEKNWWLMIKKLIVQRKKLIFRQKK